jgi:hypothetical protein
VSGDLEKMVGTLHGSLFLCNFSLPDIKKSTLFVGAYFFWTGL